MASPEYAEGALAISNIKSSRPAIAALLERYRAANGHIVHVVHDVPEGTPVFTPGTSLAEEFEELRPKDGAGANEKVVHKKFPGSFAETDLDAIVKATGLTKLVLVGYMAHVCVSTTAREGHQKGYDVLVAEDAIGDRDLPNASGEQLTQVSFGKSEGFWRYGTARGRHCSRRT